MLKAEKYFQENSLYYSKFVSLCLFFFYMKLVVNLMSDWNLDGDISHLSNTHQIHNVLCHTHRHTYWLETPEAPHLILHIYDIPMYSCVINSQPLLLVYIKHICTFWCLVSPCLFLSFIILA